MDSLGSTEISLGTTVVGISCLFNPPKVLFSLYGILRRAASFRPP